MRSWLVIPVMGIAAGGAAVLLGVAPVVAATGAALAAVVRMLAGDSPAALTGAVIAPLLAVASLAEAGGAPVRAAIALAAAGWTVAELARPPGAPISPRVVLAAAVAGLLDPAYVALLAIAGARLAATWREPRRWILAVPAAGVAAVGLAALAGTAWPGLGARWFGAAAHPVAPAELAAAAAAALGPLTAVAALAGLGTLARRRTAELALAAAVAGVILVDLRAGAPGPAAIGLAAVLAGLAIGRLAAMIRLASGQVLAGATLGVLVLLPPAWTALAQRPTAHIGQASR
ncbi:MAG: hypothetical protein E6J90_30540 [Deltaproteobacteria bacterium]|nr:MAG: hypothetical protein E6J90_30540 [Deltaproteobacteria bacterium]